MTESSLTLDQTKCFEYFKTGKSMVITGPAGCGKSFLINKIKEHCQLTKRDYGITALTGAAAALISGLTLHGWAGIGLAKGSSAELYQSMKKYRKTHINVWMEVEVLVIDEISMMSANLFNKLNSLAQLIRGNKLFFGGIQIVLCGDFAQLKPIPSQDDEGKFCFESSIWTKYLSENTFYLSKILRQSDPTFQDILESTRLGAISRPQKDILDTRLISCLDEADLNLEMPDGTYQTIKGTILYPKRKNVELTNSIELQKLVGTGAQMHVHKSIDNSVNKKKLTLSATESQIETLNKCCYVSDKVELAIGAQVMLVKNLDLTQGLVNGTRGVITEYNDQIPTVAFDNGIQMPIKPLVFEVESGNLVLTRTQIPLILAWALTIHKCQGATITNVITDLTEVFDDAQVYVTLSRVKSLDGLFITGINYSKITCDDKVKEYYQNLSSLSCLVT